ncbi:unnamed protein product, partial [marine sediment metagenome]
APGEKSVKKFNELQAEFLSAVAKLKERLTA